MYASLIAGVWLTVATAQTVGLNPVMRAKLEHAQQILGDAYVSLTMSCVQCHRQVARMRIAR